MARGSLSELETQLLIAKGLGYLSEETAAALLGSVDSVFALLGGLLRSVKERSSP
jgi:four helix bundle protein